MDYNLSILLYSNYSPRSQQLLEALKICPIDLANMVRMSSICIDNEQIRKHATRHRGVGGSRPREQVYRAEAE